MVNFRYHLVTVTAIFMALAAGIVIGVTVGQAVAPNLETRLLAAQDKAKEVDELNSELATWRSFGDKAAPGLLAGRLADVPVLMVAVRGMDGEMAKKVRDDLANADARFLGTIWFTGKLRLERVEDAATLASVLDLPVVDAPQVRPVALERLARQLVAPGGESSVPGGAAPTTTAPVPATTTTLPGATTTSTSLARAEQPTVLAKLVSAGFVDIEDPAGGKLDPQTLLPPTARFVVASGEGADVADDMVAIPFVQALVSASRPPRTVAIEPGHPARDKQPPVRSAFIGPLRASSREVDRGVSTVNNVEDFRGRAALVLALADLGLGRVGHYGVGPAADSLVPEAG